MPIPFICPHCGHQTQVAARYAGQTGPCSACGKPVTVPPLGYPPAYAAPPQKGSRAWIVVLVVAVLLVPCATIGILIALLLPAVQAAREAARRAQCTNNLKQIALAMHNYHDVNNCFPPAYIADENGRPMHSWRVLLLPYMEQRPLYDGYNFAEPWDSPANQLARDSTVKLFHCPSDPQIGPGETSYVVVVGPGTAFDGPQARSLRDVTDGSSNTIMVVELKGAHIPWSEPRDATIDDVLALLDRPGSPAAETSHPGGFNVALCDGSVRYISSAADEQTLRALLTRDGREPVGGF